MRAGGREEVRRERAIVPVVVCRLYLSENFRRPSCVLRANNREASDALNGAFRNFTLH